MLKPKLTDVFFQVFSMYLARGDAARFTTCGNANVSVEVFLDSIVALCVHSIVG